MAGPCLYGQDSAPHTAHLGTGPMLTETVHSGKLSLFSLVCLQQIIELDLKSQGSQLSVVPRNCPEGCGKVWNNKIMETQPDAN